MLNKFYLYFHFIILWNFIFNFVLTKLKLHLKEKYLCKIFLWNCVQINVFLWLKFRESNSWLNIFRFMGTWCWRSKWSCRTNTRWRVGLFCLGWIFICLEIKSAWRSCGTWWTKGFSWWTFNVNISTWIYNFRSFCKTGSYCSWCHQGIWRYAIFCWCRRRWNWLSSFDSIIPALHFYWRNLEIFFSFENRNHFF